MMDISKGCSKQVINGYQTDIGRFVLLFLILTTLVGAPSRAQESHGATNLADFHQRLSEHLSDTHFAAATWGVKVVSLDTGNVLFEHNSQKLFSPASNTKLFTVALALDRLGADYRIRTSLYGEKKPSYWGSIKGDLIVYGRGDPTINARLHNGDIFEALEPLGTALVRAGVRRINGDLVADESFFRGPPLGSGWAWDDLEYYYGAEISALTINDNTLQVNVQPGVHIGDPCRLSLGFPIPWIILSNRTCTADATARRTISFYRPLGASVTFFSGEMPVGDPGYTEDVAVTKPASLFGNLLKTVLAKRGVNISGHVRTLNWLDREIAPIRLDQLFEFGSMASLPLRDIAREVMKPSQNLYTDLLLEHIGEQMRSNQTRKDETSEHLGLAELRRFLQEIGISSEEVLFEEGSGLSRNNLTTPNAIVKLLQFMSIHKEAEIFLNSLPIAAVDGTLKNRMKGTAAANNLKAKTGTLRWATSLSGYVRSAAGERLAFCIMLNRYHNNDPNRSARAEVDGVAIMLAEFSGRSQ